MTGAARVSSTWWFLARRAAAALLLVFIVASATFLLALAAQGDFVANAFGIGARTETVVTQRALLGLDRPAATIYAEWLAGVSRLDFGVSLLFQRPVASMVGARAANTALLAAAALVIAFGVGLPLGVFTGSRGAGLLPGGIRLASVALLSLPPLLAALLLVWAAAVTGLAPVGGMTSSAAHESWLAAAWDLVRHLPVPALALGLPLAAAIERLQAQAIADALAHPCMTAALARGVSSRDVLWRHALRLGVKPVAAAAGVFAGTLLSGSFAVELVTSWPGLGRLTYDALVARDLYLAAGCASAAAAFLALGLLSSDIALALADPRTTHLGGRSPERMAAA